MNSPCCVIKFQMNKSFQFCYFTLLYIFYLFKRKLKKNILTYKLQKFLVAILENETLTKFFFTYFMNYLVFSFQCCRVNVWKTTLFRSLSHIPCTNWTYATHYYQKLPSYGQFSTFLFSSSFNRTPIQAVSYNRAMSQGKKPDLSTFYESSK